MTAKTPGVLSRIAGALRPGAAADIEWRPGAGVYPRLSDIAAPPLGGRSGLYVLWHLGVRPQWVRVGFTMDLGGAVSVLANTPEVTGYAAHDGPFLAWRECTPTEAAGWLRFLTLRLEPILQTPALACDVPLDPGAPPVACSLPRGTRAAP